MLWQSWCAWCCHISWSSLDATTTNDKTVNGANKVVVIGCYRTRLWLGLPRIRRSGRNSQPADIAIVDDARYDMVVCYGERVCMLKTTCSGDITLSQPVQRRKIKFPETEATTLKGPAEAYWAEREPQFDHVKPTATKNNNARKVHPSCQEAAWTEMM